MNPSPASAGSLSSRPTASIPLQQLSIPSVQNQKDALTQFAAYKKRIDWHTANGNSVEQRQAYREITDFLESLRPQGFFSESEISTELENLYRAYSLFERNQGNGARANELAEKAAPSLVQASPKKHTLDRIDSSPFHYAKNSTPDYLDRPQGVPLDPEFEALINGIQQINFRSNDALFLNVSSIISFQPPPASNGRTPPNEVKDTRLLACYLHEDINQSIPPQNLPFYEALAERVLRCFEERNSCTLSLVQEVILLAQATHNQGYYRRLIDKLQIEPDRILNMAALQGLTVVIQHRARLARIASDSNLTGDCTKLLKYIHQLLSRTHRKDNAIQLSALLQTVSLLLDTMFEAGLKLDAEMFKGSLEDSLIVLSKAQDTKSEVNASLALQAKYALQALKRLRYSREKLERLWDILQDFSGGAAYAAGAFGSKDPDKFWEAINRIGEGVKKIKQEWDAYYKKQEWYLALYRIDQGIKLGYLKELVPFVQGWKLPKKNYLLQGLCFRLERIALSWADDNAKKWALSLLKSLEKGGTEWGSDKELAGVKECASATLQRIGNFWRLPNTQLMERIDYAPPAWHHFWQGESQNKLIIAVQDKDQRHDHQKLLPVIKDALVEQSIQLDSVQNDLAQSSVDATQRYDELKKINTKVSEIHQQLLPTLSSDLLADVKAALTQHYEADLKIRRISGVELDLADCYINLAIVEGKAQQEADKAKLQDQASKFYRPSSYEEVKQTNLQTSIPLEKLFDKRKLHNSDEEVVPKRLLIQGRAGIGKTTLCKKLVHAYQNGLWSTSFDAVLWVPLRQLKTDNVYSLENLFKKKYFFRQNDKRALAKQLSEHTDKILFILDGLDEVATELDGSAPLGHLLRQLLDQPQVIVTSRPAGVDSTKLKVKAFDLELETVGFNQENVRAYLNKVEPESATEIQALIERTPVMRELANIPIQLDVLCYSWQEVKEVVQQDATVTMTMLYQAMEDKLWRKDAERLNENPKLKPVDFAAMISEEVHELMADEIDYLGYLSFRGLQDNLLEFESSYFDRIKRELNQKRGTNLPIPLQRHIKQGSFLHTADADLAERSRKYYFLHLTFQEFFAAKFLAKHFQAYLTAEGTYKAQVETPKGLVLKLNELQHFVNQHKYDPRYQIVWWMVAGLLSEKTLEGFFYLLEKEPRDLLGGAHFSLTMHCLHEARTRLPQSVIQHLEATLEAGLELEMKLKRSWSISQPAFPEHLLLKFLKQQGQYQREIFDVFRKRPHLSDDALAIFIEALQSGDDSINWLAAKILAPYGGNVELVQQAFIWVLDQKDEGFDLKRIAADALVPYVGNVELVQQAFLRVLDQKDEVFELRDMVAAALAPYAGSAGPIQQVFLSALGQDEDAELRGMAVGALAPYAGSAGPIQQELLSALDQDKDTELREMAADALEPYAGSNEPIQKAFLRALAQKEDIGVGVIQTAANALAPYAGSSKPIQHALLSMLDQNENNYWIRYGAAQALKLYASSAEPIQQAFLMVLDQKNENTGLRQMAADALAPYAGSAGPIQEAFLSALDQKDEEFELRQTVADAIAPYAGSAGPIQEAFLSALDQKDEEFELRQTAAKALAPYAGSAGPIQEAFLRRLVQKEDTKKVRQTAAKAIAPLMRAVLDLSKRRF